MKTATLDVEALARELADRPLVLLGEATHGTHEFYALRGAITRELVAHHGFSSIAIEGDWPDAARVDRYIKHRGDDRDAFAALGDFKRFPTWMWRNHDVVALIAWLHERAPHVGFHGLDLYSLHASMGVVLAHLDRVDPEAATRARARYACFDHAAGDAQQYGMRAHYGLEPDCEQEVVAQLVDMQRHALAGDDWFDAIQNAQIVRDAEAYYRAMFGGRATSWNLRDTHMADTLDLLRARGKVIVWAHNSHVGDSRATEMGESGQLTLGRLARQRHPGEVALVGFTTYGGTVACAYDWDEPVYVERVRPSLLGSWEHDFHDTGLATFVVRDLPPGRRLHRAIGVVYRPETERASHYYGSRMAEQFDLVVHVDRTTAVVPLDRAPFAHAPGELPETFPTGV